MVIERNGKFTKEKAKEITILLLNVKQLMKNPMKKPTDMFSYSLKTFIVGLGGLVIWGLLMIFGRSNAYVNICMGVMVAMLIVLFVYYKTIRKLYRDLINQGDIHVTLTLDEEGVDYDDHGNKKIRLFWKNISFFRAFQHVACFFPKDLSGIMITIDRSEFAKIKEFLQENHIDLQVID